MKVFFDSDVLLDIALERQPFFEASKEALLWSAKNAEVSYLAWHSCTNLYYLASRHLGKAEALEFLRDLCSWMIVAPTSPLSMQQGLDSPGRDLEDSLQYQCALAAEVNFVISRNGKDYPAGSVPVLSPSEFLARVNK